MCGTMVDIQSAAAEIRRGIKKDDSVMARYSNLLPVGILRVMFQLVFVCTYIILCLCRGTVPRR